MGNNISLDLKHCISQIVNAYIYKIENKRGSPYFQLSEDQMDIKRIIVDHMDQIIELSTIHPTESASYEVYSLFLKMALYSDKFVHVRNIRNISSVIYIYIYIILSKLG